MRLTMKAVFLTPILLVVTVGLCGLVWLGASSTRDAAESMMRSDMPIIAEAIVKDVSESMRIKAEALKTWTAIAVVQAAAAGQPDVEAFRARMAATCSAMPNLGVDYANLYTLKGDLSATSLPGPLPKTNVADRDYFQGVTAKGQDSFLSKALLSRTTNKPVIIVAVAVKNAKGETLAVLNGGVDLEKLTGQLSAAKIGTTGRVLVFEPDGTAIAHPDKEQILKKDASQNELIQKALAVTGSSIITSAEGRIAAVRKDPFTGWTFVVMAPMEDMQAQVKASVNRQALLALAVTLILATAIWIVSARVVTSPLTRCLGFAKAVAGGDLNRNLKAETSCVELRELSGALGDMVSTLKANLADIAEKEALAHAQAQKAQEALREVEIAGCKAERSRLEGLMEAATLLEDVVRGVGETSESLTARMHEAVRDVHTQQDRTAETATAMEQMNSTILEVAKNAQHAAERTGLVSEKAQGGRDLVERAVKAISGVDALAAELKAAMAGLAEKTKAVDQVMTTISDIADQTNLLALNAAIEAARAGDHGRGFAVVADEVRKLAEKTMTATKEVGETISAIQTGTLDNARQVERMAEAATQASSLAKTSGSALAEIASLVESASDQVRSIATASEEQSAASEQITRAVDEVRELATSIAQGMTQSEQIVQELGHQGDALEKVIGQLRGNQLEA